MIDELRSELNRYYRSEGIAVDNFHCRKSAECEAAADHQLTGRGSEAHLGSRYGDPIKIVVVSLGRGEGAENVWDRSHGIEALSAPNQHMRGTRDTLMAILGKDSPDIGRGSQ